MKKHRVKIITAAVVLLIVIFELCFCLPVNAVLEESVSLNGDYSKSKYGDAVDETVYSYMNFINLYDGEVSRNINYSIEGYYALPNGINEVKVHYKYTRTYEHSYDGENYVQTGAVRIPCTVTYRRQGIFSWKMVKYSELP